MDLDILNWINENLHGSNVINHIIKWITYLGETGIVWIVLSFVLLFFKKTRRCGILLALGICATGLINSLILKNIFDRARPFEKAQSLAEFIESLGMKLPDSPSFPSGHAFASFCSATILTFVYKGKGAWSFILATLISLSRVFLCVHYPTDVLAGMLIGAFVGFFVAYIGNKILNILEDKFINKKCKQATDTIKKDDENK